jgi:hypothetical protein
MSVNNECAAEMRQEGKYDWLKVAWVSGLEAMTVMQDHAHNSAISTEYPNLGSVQCPFAHMI